MKSFGFFLMGLLLLIGLMAAVQPHPRPHHVKGPPQNQCDTFEEPVQGAICGRQLWDG